MVPDVVVHLVLVEVVVAIVLVVVVVGCLLVGVVGGPEPMLLTVAVRNLSNK